jgi:hypothetical protein
MSLGDDVMLATQQERVTQQVTQNLDTHVLNDVSLVIIVTTNVVHECSHVHLQEKQTSNVLIIQAESYIFAVQTARVDSRATSRTSEIAPQSPRRDEPGF